MNKIQKEVFIQPSQGKQYQQRHGLQNSIVLHQAQMRFEIAILKICSIIVLLFGSRVSLSSISFLSDVSLFFDFVWTTTLCTVITL